MTKNLKGFKENARVSGLKSQNPKIKTPGFWPSKVKRCAELNRLSKVLLFAEVRV
ncbi:hypothetical protein [Adhaeribacter terreus]|uniref:Uncharacterized protein n=1 Tax=Adhaeribacter terreus TaxID=529703 RepID=A0ABW0E4J4_9BACT